MTFMRKFFFKAANRGWLNWVPDAAYLKLKYYASFGRKLNLSSPERFNEKLQWLKLHDRKPIYQIMADKYEAREFAAKKTGNRYIIPALGVWERFEEIDFDSLPNRFVLKCTHDSGGLVICEDKASFNRTAAREKIEKCLKRNYFFRSRERPYQNIHPRIIAEENLAEGRQGMTDYKVFCFHGKPRLILVCQGRFSAGGMTEDFYDLNWRLLDISRPGHGHGPLIPKPIHVDEMLQTAALFSEGIPFLRVDFYDTPQSLYLGEFTFYPSSGFVGFQPDSWDKVLGDWLDLKE